jgi:hypothetical protein
MSEANYNPSPETPISSDLEQNSVLESPPIAESNKEKELNLHKFAHKLIRTRNSGN